MPRAVLPTGVATPAAADGSREAQTQSIAPAPTTSAALSSAAPAATGMPAPNVAATATAVAESAEPVDPDSVDPGELEAAFVSSVDDLVAQTADLARQPCGDLSQAATANPALFASLRGYANTLKRVGTSNPDLDTDTVKSALSELDRSMGLLQGALSLCGINPS